MNSCVLWILSGGLALPLWGCSGSDGSGALDGGLAGIDAPARDRGEVDFTVLYEPGSDWIGNAAPPPSKW